MSAENRKKTVQSGFVSELENCKEKCDCGILYVHSVHSCHHSTVVICGMPHDLGVLQYRSPPYTLRAFPETVLVGQAVVCNYAAC